LEKKKNINAIGFASYARAQHDLDQPVLLVAELLIHLGCVFEAGRMRDDKAWINLAGFDPQQPSIGLNMSLPGLDRKTLVHGSAERNLVAHADIDTRNGNRAEWQAECRCLGRGNEGL
jgi:hypothetical protein